MQLNAATDYALKAMVYLATKGDTIVNTAEISQEMDIPNAFLYNILGKYRKAGYIEAVRGVKGGWRLLKKPQDITVYDLFMVSEDTLVFDRALEKKAPETPEEHRQEPFYELFALIQAQLERNLKNHSLQDVLVYCEDKLNFEQ